MRSGGAAECVFGVADASGRVTRTVAVPLERPVLMHDFAITQRHAVFVEGSLVMDPSVCGAGHPAGSQIELTVRLHIMLAHMVHEGAGQKMCLSA